MFKGIFPVLQTTDLVYEASASVNFMNTLVGIFPSNFFAPFVEANMLQSIVASLWKRLPGNINWSYLLWDRLSDCT